MKNNTLRVILTVVGAVVTLGAMVLAIVHFWDDIKSLLPAKKDEDFDEDFRNLRIRTEESEKKKQRPIRALLSFANRICASVRTLYKNRRIVYNGVSPKSQRI